MVDDGSDQEDDDYSCLAEWQLIQTRLKRVDDSMKCEIRNLLREIACPESTSLKAPKDKASSKEEAAAWEYPFMDRQCSFRDLLAEETKEVKKKILKGVGSSKNEPLLC
ncbi:hypothetical protein P8452_34999 [Trifolium repens]|nr:hypothetical protein P8452_34999 [Trifolium repens]